MSADPAGWELINPMDEDGEPVPNGWPEGFGPGPSVGMRPGYSVIEATNWYAYVSNNPVKYVDPTGMQPIGPSLRDYLNAVLSDIGSSGQLADTAITEAEHAAKNSPPGQIVGATNDFIGEYITMRKENVKENDHYHHAMANSKAAQRGHYGKRTAQALSFIREATDILRKLNTDEPETMRYVREDNIANRFGRSIPEGADPYEYNKIFETSRGGKRAELSDVEDRAPENTREFREAFSTRDEME